MIGRNLILKRERISLSEIKEWWDLQLAGGEVIYHKNLKNKWAVIHIRKGDEFE